MKYRRSIIISLTIFLALLPISLAQTQSHPLSQITPIDVNLNMYQKNIINVSNLGIGTTNPSYNLHVVGNAYISDGLVLAGNLDLQNNLLLNTKLGSNLNANGYSIIGTNWVNATNVNVSNQLCLGGICKTSWPSALVGGSGATNYIAIWTDSSNLGNSWLYQSGSDLVLSSSHNFNLESGSLKIGGATVIDSSRNLANVNQITANGPVDIDSGTLYVDSSNDRVGIGTNTPQAKLDIEYLPGNQGTIAIFGSSTRVRIIDEGPGLPSGVAAIGPTYGLGLYATAGPLRFFTGGTTSGYERMRIDTSGNVGIGTTNPTYRLTIVGDINATGFVKGSQLCIGDDCRNSWPDVSGESGWTDEGTYVRLTTSSDKVIIGADYVPQQKLDIVGNLNVTGWSYLKGTIHGPVLITMGGDDQGIQYSDCWNGDCSVNVFSLYADSSNTVDVSSSKLRVGGIAVGNSTSLPSSEGEIRAVNIYQNGNQVIDTINAGNGISVSGSGNSRTIAIKLYSGSGLIADSTGLSLNRSCSTGQVLKWNGNSWYCANDENSGGTVSGSGSANALAYWQDSSTLADLSFGSSGQFLKSQGSGNLPVWDTIELGTDTEGNYVATLTAGTGISITGIGTEAANPTIAIDTNVVPRKSIAESISGVWNFDNGLEVAGGYSSGGLTIDNKGNILTHGNLTYSGYTYVIDTLEYNGTGNFPFGINVGGTYKGSGYNGFINFNDSSGNLKGKIYTDGTNLIIEPSGSLKINGNTYLQNHGLEQIDHIAINDVGANEGLKFPSSNGWVIDVSPRDRSNNDGNLNLYGTGGSIVVWRNVEPSSDNSIDLGSSTYRFKNAYFSGTVHASAFEGAISANNVEDIWVNETGDTMSGNLNMADNNILDANTIQANNLEDPEDTTLQVSDNLYVTGSLGVGVSPSYKLHVSGAGKNIVEIESSQTSSQAGIRFFRTGTNDYANIYIENYSGNANLHRLVIETSDDGDSDYIVLRNHHWDQGDKDVMEIHRSYITANATLRPLLNNYYDLGISSCQWANIYGVNIYQNGNQVIDTINAGNGISVSGSGNSRTIAIKLYSGSGLIADSTGLSLNRSCSTGQVLKWNGNSWYCANDENSGGTVSGSGSAGQVAFWTGSSSISGDENLFWDNTTKRLGIGTSSPAADLDVYGGDTDVAKIYVRGSNQGTGMVYVGQSTSYGGGIVYNGDDNPDLPFTTDAVSFFRRNGGTDSEVFYYPYNSNTVYFNGDIDMKGHDIKDVSTVQANTLEDPEDAWFYVNDNLEVDGNIKTDTVSPRSDVIAASGSNLLTVNPYADNALGFRTPYKVEKWDGSSWVDITSDKTWGYLTDGKPSTYVSLEGLNYTSNRIKIRLYYDFGAKWVTPAQQLVLHLQHMLSLVYLKVEQADDSGITTNVNVLKEVSSSTGCGDCTLIVPTSTFWRRYLRIELEFEDTGDNEFRELAYYSPAYWASSKLIGSMIPIDWDYHKNVFFSGNVGIGTTNPSYTLDVAGDIHASGGIYASTLSGNLECTGCVSSAEIANGAVKAEDLSNPLGGSINASAYYDSDNSAYYLDPSNTGISALFAGKVGIATTSISQTLDVNGNIAAKNIYLNKGQSEGSIYYVDIIKGFNDIRFRLGSNSYFYFQDSGGATKAWIDYKGNAKFDGNITLGSGTYNQINVIKGLRIYYTGDDTEVSTTNNDWTTVKQTRIYFDSDYGIKPRYITFIASIWNSGGGATYLRVCVGSTCSGTLSTSNTGETFVEGSIDISSLSEGVYNLDIDIYASDGTAYQRYIDIYYVF